MKPQDVLEYVSGPMPVPAEGEVLIRMKAAPINPADINFVQGVYGVKPVLPHSRAGLEGCGVVQESRAEGFRKDDEVILLRGVGSWSEYVAVPAVNVMKLPVKVDPVQAAMLKVNPLTALRMLEGFVSLTPGDWVVQNASNSGVGRCIIQLAREMGVKTVNFVRRPDELRDELTALGADLVVGEDDEDVEEYPGPAGRKEARAGLQRRGRGKRPASDGHAGSRRKHGDVRRHEQEEHQGAERFPDFQGH